MSSKKALTYSFFLFIVGLILLSWFHFWWPGILLAIGIPLALRNYFQEKYSDLAMVLVVFGGIFVIVQFHLSDVYLPLFFGVGGLYVYLKGFFASDQTR